MDLFLFYFFWGKVVDKERSGIAVVSRALGIKSCLRDDFLHFIFALNSSDV